MSLKRFNLCFRTISNGDTFYSTEDEAHLYCLLKETILATTADDFVNGIQDLPSTFHNLHQVIQKCDSKSGPFGKSVELIEKMILSLNCKQDILRALPVLPILTDVLLRSSSRTDHILELIQDLSFGVIIKTCHPFVERLLKYCINVVCNEGDYDEKLRSIALSILINLCSKNVISLNILEQQVNLVDLQKKITLEAYGILACKMTLLLNECGHILRDPDVRNFLKYTTKELHRIPSLDEKSLKHLIEFIRDISHRPNTKKELQTYDFCSGIQAAIMTLENAVDSHISPHINGLFEIIKIVTVAKNESLKNLVITLVNFGIKRLTFHEHSVQALETLATIFSNDPNISTSNFELEEMQESLKSLIFSSEKNPTVMAPLFKLLNVLARNYNVNLIKAQCIESIFAPLLKCNSSCYFKLPIVDVTMYLECLAMLSTLLEFRIIEIKLNLFQETNIKHLVAMSIKHGNTDQCCLALSLLNRFSKRDISEIISSKSNDKDIRDPQNFPKKNQDYGMGKNLSDELGNERIKNIFINIEKACFENKITVPTSDFIELYSNEMAALNMKIDLLTQKYDKVSNEVSILEGRNLELQTTSLKWSELAQNLQKSNETLLSDKEKLNVIVTSLRSTIKSSLGENEDTIRRLGHEKSLVVKRNKEMEDELKDIEDMRQTILSLMSKRKKTTTKDS